MSRSRDTSRAARALARLGCLLLGGFLIAPTLLAQPVSQYDVEAAYLYNFGKFITWPAEARQSSPTFDICILGRDPFGGTLDRLIAKDQIGGRPMRKRMIKDPKQAAGCAIVYIADSEAAVLPRVLEELDHQEALLVSGLPHFVQSGGMIQFVREGDRVRFAVNLDAASKCLKVAVSVMGKQGEGVRQ